MQKLAVDYFNARGKEYSAAGKHAFWDKDAAFAGVVGVSSVPC